MPPAAPRDFDFEDSDIPGDSQCRVCLKYVSKGGTAAERIQKWRTHFATPYHRSHAKTYPNFHPFGDGFALGRTLSISDIPSDNQCGICLCVIKRSDNVQQWLNSWKVHLASWVHKKNALEYPQYHAFRGLVAPAVQPQESRQENTTCSICGATVQYIKGNDANKANCLKMHLRSNVHRAAAEKPTTTVVADNVCQAPTADRNRSLKMHSTTQAAGLTGDHVSTLKRAKAHTAAAATNDDDDERASPRIETLEATTCSICGAVVQYIKGNAANRANCLKMHLRSNVHRAAVAKKPTTTVVADKVCQAPTRHIAGNTTNKNRSPKMHSTPEVHQQAARLTTLKCAKAHPAAAATNGDDERAPQLETSKEVGDLLFSSTAVRAAVAFVQANPFPGSFVVNVDECLLADNDENVTAVLKKLEGVFRRAACARDEIIALVKAFRIPIDEELVSIKNVPRHSQARDKASIRRRQLPTFNDGHGTRREFLGGLPFKVDLPIFPLPQVLRFEVPYPDTEATCGHLLRGSSLSDKPTVHMHNLLHCEEACVKASLREYDMEGVTFTQGSFGLLRLRVPGLAEKRPTVLVNDVIEAFDEVAGKRYIGYVHYVYHDEIDVNFPHSVVVGTKYAIHFTCKRSEFRSLHRAVDRVKFLRRPLLTAADATPHDSHFRSLFGAVANWILPDSRNPDVLSPTPLVTLNELQRTFVEQTAASTGVLLRILWGPPGTGKTTTIVAYVASIVLGARGKTGLKILVATPSNGASDLIVKGLLKHLAPKTEVLRVMALSRSVGDAPVDVRKACCVMEPRDSDERSHTVTTFRSPGDDEVTKAVVIVSTLGSCSRLYSIHPDLCFSHVVVDECGQATEPELCAALQFAGLDKVVIAGDPKQLGPITTSLSARQKGLGTSPLVRLIESKAPTTMLKECYRCHPDILSTFNPVFYGSKLVPASTETVKFAAGVDACFPKFRVKLLHCGGSESYDPKSPSIMNIHEASLVVAEIQRLKAGKVKIEDIAVIAPYALQVKKIREMLRLPPLLITDKEWLSNHVCSVEAFQGREAKYIILSCVRSPENISDLVSNAKIVAGDVRRHLGFLSQPQRSNVALSRAIDGMVIIGNLRLLWWDTYEAVSNEDNVSTSRKGVWRQVLASALNAGAECDVLDLLHDTPALVLEASSTVDDALPQLDTFQHGVRRCEE